MNDRILNPAAILLVLGVLVFSGPTVRLIKRTKFTILDILTSFVVIVVLMILILK